MEKYDWNTAGKRVIFDMEGFWHLVWLNLTSCKFSHFLFLIPLYISSGVFINKVLWGFIMWQNMSTHTIKVHRVVFSVLLWLFVCGQTCFLVCSLTNDLRLIQGVHYLNIHLRLGLITFASFLYSGLGVWPRFTIRPFYFLSCIMRTGQDSRPIHMSHLNCSKLILVSKVKQNNSRFSFALPWFIKPKSWEYKWCCLQIRGYRPAVKVDNPFCILVTCLNNV